MSKRYYFPNRKIEDKRLPFDLQITSGLTVYYSEKGKTQLRKADSFYLKKTGILSVSIDDYEIKLKGTDKDGNIIYDIIHQGKLLEEENENDKT